MEKQIEDLKQRYIKVCKSLNAELEKSPRPPFSKEVAAINGERNEIYNMLLYAGVKVNHIMPHHNGYISPIKVVHFVSDSDMTDFEVLFNE